MQGFRLLILLLFFIPSITLSGEFRKSFISWGTNLDFIVRSDLKEEDVNSIIREIHLIPSSLELIFNSKNANSELHKFNNLKSDQEMFVSSDLIYLLEESILYNKITEGYFDPTAQNFVENKYANANKENNECTGFANLVINSKKKSLMKKKECLRINLDGLAEGYAINLMLLKFKEKGIRDILINFGGNVSTLSDKTKWKVSIKNPNEEYSINSTYDLDNLSVSTSSQYSKTIKFNNETFSHIYNPKMKLLKPIKNISFSVIADNPIYADAVSTALQAMPLETALQFLKKDNNIRALVLNTDSNKKTEVIYNNFQ